MSEEKTQATTETVSESPAQETVQNSSNDQYIAESKKYRKRAQDAEARLAELESKFTKQEEAKMIEEGKKDELISKYQSENKSLTENADKWAKYEKAKRAVLLEKHPENERENLSKLDLETLEYVTGKINNSKPNAPETLGTARKKISNDKVDYTDRGKIRGDWKNIIDSYK